MNNPNSIFDEKLEEFHSIIQKLDSSGIEINPFDYDFVYSHIPVGILKKPLDNFNYSKIFAPCKQEKSSFYIHIPFCINKCLYCYFPKKQKTIEDEISDYLILLEKEFLLLKNYFSDWKKINSIYIGGGTPSVLNLEQLEKLFKIVDAIKKLNNNRCEVETAIELHPSCIDKSKLDYLILGKKINRISFGIQSFNAEILKKLHRSNSGYEWLINYLKEIKFENWNIDLIYGTPYQTLDHIKYDLKKIIEISPPSITWYQLWYKPRKKENNVILEDIEKNEFMSKSDILNSRMHIYQTLIENGYKNLSENWFVKDKKFYTKYEEDKIKSEGNIGIGLGVYQAYGNYIYENFSDWNSYKIAIESEKIPIQWIREMGPLEQFVRKTIMELKGLSEPEPIILEEFEKFKILSKGRDTENFFTKIIQLQNLEIVDIEGDKLIINKKYHLLRDYLICYLLHDNGWNIEKEGILESLCGFNISEAKDIIKKLIGNHPNSISFFIAIFNEEDKKFKISISKNYINDANNNSVSIVSSPDFSKDTEKTFSFLKRFYLPPEYLKRDICIISGEPIDKLKLISININNIENEIQNFLKILGLDCSSIETDFRFVKEYYSSTIKKWLMLSDTDSVYIYHIPFFPEFGVGGIEIASTKCFEIDELQNIKKSVIGCFTDRLSHEINKYEKFMFHKYALCSAIAAIMARNKSHIHGSHIEHGLRNKISTFDIRIMSKIIKEKENTEFYKKILEISEIKLGDVEIKDCKKNYDIKKYLFLTFIKDEAQKRLSFYRQRQNDLSARMATEWPQWGCSIDFYTHILLPIKKNPLVLHFINLSDGYTLKDIEIKFGCYIDDANDAISWVRETVGFDIQKEKDADLVDFALHLITSNSDANVDGKPLSEYFRGYKFQSKNWQPFLVSLRDADIGAQAFFALFEGIIRNASKHGLDDNNDGYSCMIKIVGCDSWDLVKLLVDFDDENYPQINQYKYKYMIISIGRDLIMDGHGIRKIGEVPLIKALRCMIDNGIINDTGKIIPGNWGIKEMKICAAFVAGESIETTQEKSPDYAYIGKTRGKKIWEDSKERICYVIRFNKPRIALVVVPNNSKPQDSLANEWEGVRFVDCPTNIFDGVIDYDFLYVDDSFKDEVLNSIEMNKTALPQRIVYDNIDFKSSSLDNSLKFGCHLYDEFFKQKQCIIFPSKINEINFRIYFDDDDISKAWERSIDREMTYDNIKMTIDFVKMDNPKCFNESDSSRYQICISRHRNLTKGLAIINQNRITKTATGSFYPYYAQYISAFDQFFSFLISLEPIKDQNLSNFIIRQLIEACLLNVLIIDERISESLHTLNAPDEPNIRLSEKLYWMGINIVKSLRIESVDIWKTPFEKDKAKKESSDGQKERLVDFVFKEDGGIETEVIDGLPIHIIFIHATRFIEMHKNFYPKLSKEDFINKIRERIPHVIVHSGRGKTEGDIPDNAPFLEYSTLEKYVLSEPSKFYLIQIALSVKGEKKSVK